MQEFEIGDWVYADDWCYGQIVDMHSSWVIVEFETSSGGGSYSFKLCELQRAPAPNEADLTMNEKKKIYDELSRVLTDFENGEANELDLYNMLTIIQNRWEDTITVIL